MTTVVSTITSIISMFGSVLDFILEEPLLLTIICIPIVGTIIWIVTSLFRK